MLYLWGNQLHGTNIGMFHNMNKLLYLQLNKNRISTIEPGTFAELKALRILYLWGNQLTTIESGMFRNLYNLEKLLLNSNKISNIQSGSFSSLFSLKVLALSTNRFMNLSPNLFINLPRSPLQLGLSDARPSLKTNTWNCFSLCWLKLEEQQGTIRWWVPEGLTEHAPVCAAGGDWDMFQCPELGESGFQNSNKVTCYFDHSIAF